MKVLFAVSNDKMSESIVKQYQKEYKQIISYKNVYYFNAILKELQRDKTYERIVISEDLEQYVNNDYEQMDKFIFDRLDSISDEASNLNGEDIPIILICAGRRNKAEQIFVKLFGIGIYNAIIGNDRSVNEVCRLINRPRSKKEAKIYYKIDADDVTYEKDNENDVSEIEIQNILAHYKRLGNNEEKYVESFDSIASQYNDAQLKVISQCLPLNVRAVLEEKSIKYQQVNSYNNKISDKVRIKKEEKSKGTTEILLKNAANKRIKEPVVIPTSIDTFKRKKIETHRQEDYVAQPNNLAETRESNDEDLLSDIGLEELPDVPQEVEIPSIEETLNNMNIDNSQILSNTEQEEQPKKRGRGRPRKVVQEPEVKLPKRGRGRPRKVQPVQEETVLPGFEKEEEGILPGFEEQAETILPGFEEQEETILPGFGEQEETILPGFEEQEETMLPGLEEQEEEGILPGFENQSVTNLKEEKNNKLENEYTNVLQNLRKENTEICAGNVIPNDNLYQELNLNELLMSNQKIVAFLGTSKNGTSFLINNVAELLSESDVDVAILDLTQNRNAYYIYTKNEEELRQRTNYTFSNLKTGRINGIQVHRNLTVYTSPLENEEDLKEVEPIIETLVRNHTLILMDCDFTTPARYFKYAQEIYLVQSMDILTIQPLTAFVRQLKDKNMFNESKVRVVLNKFIRTKEINEGILIGGISIYNDPGMTVRKELFNRRNVEYVTIPFELKTYLRYLDGLVICDVSLKGYSKEFMQSLKKLGEMVYKTEKNKGRYMPPSVKNNRGNF